MDSTICSRLSSEGGMFSDKFITDEDVARIKKVLTMTKVDRFYYEERR